MTEISGLLVCGTLPLFRGKTLRGVQELSKIKYQNLMLLMAGVLLSVLPIGNFQKSYAASQNECAIWLCLPGGFPSGCGAAYGAMIDRIKSRKSPLPNFSSCSTEGSGKYVMGYEQFEPCKDGFAQRQKNNGVDVTGMLCFNTNSICDSWRRGNRVYVPPGLDCISYDAIRRPKPYFVEMWANDAHIGKFFYQ